MADSETTIFMSLGAGRTQEPIIDETRWFYVACMNDQGNYRRLLGPYALHAAMPWRTCGGAKPKRARWTQRRTNTRSAPSHSRAASSPRTIASSASESRREVREPPAQTEMNTVTRSPHTHGHYCIGTRELTSGDVIEFADADHIYAGRSTALTAKKISMPYF